MNQRGFGDDVRKIVAGLFTSLDGVVEAPEKWTFAYFNQEIAEAIGAQLRAADTLLLGRRTYEEWAAYWPKQPGDVPFADFINTTPKLVVSRSLKKVGWQHSRLVNGDVVQDLRRLKGLPGKDILINGSATLVRSLLREGLIDELRLMVFPIALGAGRRLFEDESDQVSLKLLQTQAFSTGVLSIVYEPAGRGGQDSVRGEPT